MQIKQSNTPDNEKMPLVSFIVPCYNIPTSMLQECIESIKSLTLRDYEREIILVDDGSPTIPNSILNRYADDIVYVKKPNGGISTARNMGMRIARGHYLQFVDGDDKLLRAAYEHVLDIARYGDANLILFDFSRNDQEGNKPYKDEDATSGSQMMRNNNIHGSVWSYLIKRAIIGNLTFTPGIDYGEDEEFSAQLLLRADTVVRTTAKAYYYRPRATSALHNKSIRKKLKRLNDAMHVIKHLNLIADTLPMEEHAALARRVHQLTMDYIYNIILLTRNRHFLNRKLEILRSMSLYPLPDRDYTTKYTWFRRLANSEHGLSLLMKTLPLTQKEP